MSSLVLSTAQLSVKKKRHFSADDVSSHPQYLIRSVSLLSRYLQRPGSRVTMKQVTDWAKRPFAGEQIYVVGSAYNPYRGYAEGAVMSANNALNDGWQIPIPSPPQSRLHAPKSFAEVNWRNIR